uniref:Uncharacterized protein n=1 Tax=Knipowitschia caucasica TaxID=637954 RepID=A0AAV2MT25_KNICA
MAHLVLTQSPEGPDRCHDECGAGGEDRPSSENTPPMKRRLWRKNERQTQLFTHKTRHNLRHAHGRRCS